MKSSLAMSTVISSLRRKSKQRRERPLRRIIQQTGLSCGVAAVAMLARIGYRDAFRVGTELWGKAYWEESHRTNASELREMLAALGWRLGRMVKRRTWRKVPPGALVAVQRKRKTSGDEWHWVVSAEDDTGAYFLDPRKSVKTLRRRDFKNARPSWYHRVTPL